MKATTEQRAQRTVMTPHRWQSETVGRMESVPANVVSGNAHRIGMGATEPIIMILDALIRYAKAHEKRFESKLAQDYVLGVEWLAMAKGARALLNGDGAVAHERGLNTDSKDNGACEAMFWDALEIAGFGQEDLSDEMKGEIPAAWPVFKITRSYSDGRRNRTIKTGLTLAEAQVHCKDPKTRKAGEWFDGYEFCRK